MSFYENCIRWWLSTVDRFCTWKLLRPFRNSPCKRCFVYARFRVHQFITRKPQLELADFSLLISNFQFIEKPTRIRCRGLSEAHTLLEGLTCEKGVFGFYVRSKNPSINKCFARPKDVFDHIERKINEGRFSTPRGSVRHYIDLYIEAERDLRIILDS